MKKFTPIAVMAFVMAIVLSSCSPYEEGPALSLRSKSERVANTWRINYAVESDGDDVTDSYDGDTYIFDKEGNLTINFTELGASFTATGTWEFTNDDKNILIKTSYTIPVVNIDVDLNDNWEILKLKEDEMWAKDTDDDQIEIHFVP